MADVSGWSPDWDAMAVVGWVARTHGIRGEVIVNPETDFPEQRFRAGARFYVRRGGHLEHLDVSASRLHQGRPILVIDGIDSMTAAEALAGLELRVPDTDLEALEDGTYYRHQLVGCRVETVDGRAVGVVTAVSGPLERSHLVVHGDGGEVLVPLVAPICRVIEPATGRIVIDPPPGLLELNTTAGLRGA
jgi:16S rRNA processing protein RimM